MTKYKLTTSELEEHLNEQLGDLQRSAHAFDQGYRSEAKRMATILRILLHTRRSPSLLKQLGRDKIDFVDTNTPFNAANLLTYHGLVGIRVDRGVSSYYAKLETETEEKKWTEFDLWWSETIFADQQKWKLTRSDLVLTTADQNGGAHVDGSLEGVYAAISRENSLGWQTEAGSSVVGAELAGIRQIAHEVLRTLRPAYSRTLDEASATFKQSGISNGKLRFGPGERIFFANDIPNPLPQNRQFEAQIVVDSISTGSVRFIAGGVLSDPIREPGVHKFVMLPAGGKTGIFGDYTDAIVDCVSLILLEEVGL